MTRLAVGGLVVASTTALFASTRPWIHVQAHRSPPFGPVAVDVTGRHWFSALFVLSVLPLLAAALVFVTRGAGRRLVGVLVVVIGAALATVAVRGQTAPSPGRLRELVGEHLASTSTALDASLVFVWPSVLLVAAAAVVAAGVDIGLRAGQWQGGLARRYEAPARAATAEDAWHVLDRGDDPTIGGQ